MYLVDTNVWLERLLDQARAEEVGQFLDRVPSNQLFIADFAFHSIGVVLTRLGRADALVLFVHDIFINGTVGILPLGTEDTHRLVEVIDRFHLDFDDAYQYVTAEKYDLMIVSFDADFDRTDRERAMPADVPGGP